MKYLSIFGTSFATLILSMSFIGIDNQVAAQSAIAAKASVKVNISGLRNQKGDVIICLSSNAKAYPDCNKDKTARKQKIPASNGSSVIFENVDPGVYALALVHDKNRNGKMDIALFLPKEGFGMSNNPKVRAGKPKFKNSQFTVGTEDIVHNIKMRYIL